MITLVLGGARSGKSEVAERIAAASPAPVTYVATAVVDPTDADFAARVERHRARRPREWRTVEAADDLPAQLCAHGGTVLVDALGTWVAAALDFVVDADGLVAALRDRRGDTVLVSEELGLGVHPYTELGGRFRDAVGMLNRAVADVADQVLLVVAGRELPLPRSPW